MTLGTVDTGQRRRSPRRGALGPTDLDRSARDSSTSGRHVLACASAGGHLTQLVALVGRIPQVERVTWLTHDQGVAADLLHGSGHADARIVHTAYAAPRDLPNLARNARSAWPLVRSEQFDLAVSTGAGIAVATLPVARIHGVRSVYVESATRSGGPSLSGRILARVPGIEMCTQNPGFPDGWRLLGSVHDPFAPGQDRPPRLERIVVTIGTIRPYGFRRLLERLTTVLPADADVLWQTGTTDVSGLDIPSRPRVPPAELERAMQEADVVIAHAGTGTAVTAFALGVAPVLVPRSMRHGEHVDDHQVHTARMLARRGLATHLEVEDLTLDALLDASRRTVGPATDVPPIDL